MQNNILQECNKHHKNKYQICLAQNCNDRFLCSSCNRKHANNHYQFWMPINEVYDKDKKVILFQEIDSNIRKIKNNINEIKDNYYTKIDSLFTKYLKKLKEEKLEKYFENIFKKIDENTGNFNNNENNLENIAKIFNNCMKNESWINEELIDKINKKIEKSCILIEEKLNYLINQIFLLNDKIKLKNIDNNNYQMYPNKNNQYTTYGRILLDDNTDKIYYINGCNLNKMDIYENFQKFSDKIIEKSINLPTNITGIYSVLHKNYFYYFEYDNNPTNKLIKYDLVNQKITSSKYFLLDDAVKDGSQGNWSGYNDSILISDNEKLYVVYSSISNNKKINIALINEDDLSIIKIWKTDSKEKKNCPCIFMIGSTLYHLNNSYSTENNSINYAYDLETEKSYNPNIAFINKGGYDTSLTYYPKINSLMTVNNRNVYVYKVELTMD